MTGRVEPAQEGKCPEGRELCSRGGRKLQGGGGAFPSVTQHSHPCVQVAPSPGGFVGKQDPAAAAGPCSGHQFCDSPPSSGLSQPLCQPSESSFLPAFFLPLPTLNRLRQQDGTNLWLNSPKITRDLSKAVCVKLTGACTLLSNALSSEAGQGTPMPLTSLSSGATLGPSCFVFC